MDELFDVLGRSCFVSLCDLVHAVEEVKVSRLLLRGRLKEDLGDDIVQLRLVHLINIDIVVAE